MYTSISNWNIFSVDRLKSFYVTFVSLLSLLLLRYFCFTLLLFRKTIQVLNLGVRFPLINKINVFSRFVLHLCPDLIIKFQGKLIDFLASVVRKIFNTFVRIWEYDTFCKWVTFTKLTIVTTSRQLKKRKNKTNWERRHFKYLHRKIGKTEIFPENRLFSEVFGFSSDSETVAFYELSVIENLYTIFF